VTTLPTFAVGPRVAILACLSDSLVRRKFPPTLREIAEATGMAHNTVEHHLSRLRAEGYVTWTYGRQRTLRFAEGGQR
jgi:DNA-binding transcriptional ArsR family regulator